MPRPTYPQRPSPLPRTAFTALAALALVAVLTTGCGDSAPPVGSVAVEPATTALPYPGSRQVELAWGPKEGLDAASARPRVFVHLLPEGEKEVLRTFDHPLPETWRAGSDIRYPLELYQSMLGPPLAEGTYRLTVGLYDEDQRWPLEGGEEAGRREYAVAQVEVPAAQPENLPKLEYEGNWSPLMAGTDRQVLGFRYVGADATLRITEVPEDGTLGISLEINPVPEGFDRVSATVAPASGADGAEPGENSDGEDATSPEVGSAGAGDSSAGGRGTGDGEPALHVLVACDGTETTLSGLGRSDLEVDLTAGTDCAVRLSPNYAHRPAAGQEPDAPETSELARLVLVTWNPAK